ncbi:MAG TPA: ABC transporter substrate-binding protein [Burkholderiaceae bacterium]
MHELVKIALTAALVGAALFQPAAAADPVAIRIGVIGPITGKNSEDMGQSIVGGARVFLSDVNQFGGIMGRPVEIIERDDRADPERGAAIAKEMVEQNVAAVVGFGNTGVALAAAKILQEARIPVIVSGSTGAVVTKSFMPPAYPVSYIFRTSASDAIQPVVILNDLIDKRKMDRIALIHDDSPYGMNGKTSLLAELDKRGLKPVAAESFKVGDADLSAQLRRIKESSPQAIVLYCLAGDAANIVKTAGTLQMHQAVVGPWTLSQESFIAKAGGAAEGVRTVVTFVENDASSSNSQFTLAYRKLNKVTRIPSAVGAAQTYDALRLLALAMYQANSTDGVQVQRALENLDQHTASTVITRYFKPFSATDHEAISLNMAIMGEIRNGKVTYAYKEDENRSTIARTKAPSK